MPDARCQNKKERNKREIKEEREIENKQRERIKTRTILDRNLILS